MAHSGERERVFLAEPREDADHAMPRLVVGEPRREDDAPRGQILLFTGVRYERLPDADAPAVPQRRRS